MSLEQESKLLALMVEAATVAQVLREAGVGDRPVIWLAEGRGVSIVRQVRMLTATPGAAPAAAPAARTDASSLLQILSQTELTGPRLLRNATVGFVAFGAPEWTTDTRTQAKAGVADDVRNLGCSGRGHCSY